MAFSAVIGRASMGAANGLDATPRVGGGPLAAPPAPRVVAPKGDAVPTRWSAARCAAAYAALSARSAASTQGQ